MKWLYLLVGCLVCSFAEAQVSHEQFTAVLSTHAKSGLVNYEALCKDRRLEAYITKLQKWNPASITNRNDLLAFWINAYNAYTLKVICDNYPVKSINDLHTGGRLLGAALKTTVWDRDFALINSARYSLNHIEHKIIRVQFTEPRAHFALVCASLSCPPLRPEAYEGSKLNHQLNEQGALFFGDPSRNTFDPAKKKASLSKILDWYQKDFGKNEQEVLLFVSRFLRDNLAAAIRQAPESWKVDYLDYDWGLNDTNRQS